VSVALLLGQLLAGEISRSPFLDRASPLGAGTSEATAVALRSLYFVVSDALDRLRYLRHGLAAVLVFTGAKMIGSEWVHISPGMSVSIIALVLGVTIAVSKWPRRITEKAPLEGDR
jgi:hypothetical protein